MPNQSLVDLTERTATADTDLIHVNSGGTDYKQAKSNFTADLATNVSFDNTSTLESQIEALGNTFHVYTGYIESYGHQTATGVPQNTNFFVTVYVKDASHKRVVIRRAISGNEAYTKYYGGSSVGWSEWVQEPSRSEITSINNSLTPSSTTDAFTIANSNITNLERAYIRKYGKVCVVDLTFTVGTAITDSNAVLFTGLPNGIGNQRFRIPHGYDASKADLALALTTDGKIINQWTSGGIGTGQWQGQFTYIMA